MNHSHPDLFHAGHRRLPNASYRNDPAATLAPPPRSSGDTGSSSGDDDLAVSMSSPGSRRPAWTSSTVGHRCPISAPVWVGDHVTAAREAITMWDRVVLPARQGAGWPSPKSQHGSVDQKG